MQSSPGTPGGTSRPAPSSRWRRAPPIRPPSGTPGPARPPPPPPSATPTAAPLGPYPDTPARPPSARPPRAAGAHAAQRARGEKRLRGEQRRKQRGGGGGVGALALGEEARQEGALLPARRIAQPDRRSRPQRGEDLHHRDVEGEARP